MGLRPDRAVIVYSNLIRQTYKKTPIILGGIEASLRRMAHYDYWENKVKHSILMDSGADLISYGMGEHSIIEIAEALDSGIPVEEITYVAGTVYKCKDLSRTYQPVVLPSFEEVKEDKMAYARSFAIQYQNTDPFTAATMAESYGNKGYVIQNPPALPLTPLTTRTAAFLHWRRSNSASPATGAVLEAAASAPSPSIREGSCRPEAMNPFSKKRFI